MGSVTYYGSRSIQNIFAIHALRSQAVNQFQGRFDWDALKNENEDADEERAENKAKTDPNP